MFESLLLTFRIRLFLVVLSYSGNLLLATVVYIASCLVCILVGGILIFPSHVCTSAKVCCPFMGFFLIHGLYCCVRFYSILFYPITLEGRRGTTDEFATIPFHLDLFSAALVELAKSIPVHSLILSSHLFFCLPLFLFPFTVP